MEGLGDAASSDNEIDEDLANNVKKNEVPDSIEEVNSKTNSSSHKHSDNLTCKGANLEPLYIIDKAFQKVKAPGSSTVLVGILNKDNLKIANLGDSGFVHYRQQDCVLSKQHSSSVNSS